MNLLYKPAIRESAEFKPAPIPDTEGHCQMKVGIIGTGYVGLVSGTCFADLGHKVVCVDVDETKIARLRAGEVPIYEPGLEEMIRRNVRAERLSFTTSIDEAVQAGLDFLFIAVGTPSNGETGAADLNYLHRAVRDGAEAVRRAANGHSDAFTVFVVKSTVPVGTVREVSRVVSEYLPDGRCAVAFNPEFLREGNAIADFLEPDRIVIGCDSERAREMLAALYRPLTDKGYPLVETSTVESAELIKYAANAFLATKITFINELAMLCESTNADIEELAHGIGLDARIGASFLKAGPGYGGSCFPKDTRELVCTAQAYQSPLKIVETVIAVNESHKRRMVDKVRRALGGRLDGKRIAVLGLAFKANTDDMRDAPALTILPPLLEDGAEVVDFDPEAVDNARVVPPYGLG